MERIFGQIQSKINHEVAARSLVAALKLPIVLGSIAAIDVGVNLLHTPTALAASTSEASTTAVVASETPLPECTPQNRRVVWTEKLENSLAGRCNADNEVIDSNGPILATSIALGFLVVTGIRSSVRPYIRHKSGR